MVTSVSTTALAFTSLSLSLTPLLQSCQPAFRIVAGPLHRLVCGEISCSGPTSSSLSESLFCSASAFTSPSVSESVFSLPLLACEPVLLLVSLPPHRTLCRQVPGPLSLIVRQPVCPPHAFTFTSPSLTQGAWASAISKGSVSGVRQRLDQGNFLHIG